jgi:hypothetical protein
MAAPVSNLSANCEGRMIRRARDKFHEAGRGSPHVQHESLQELLGGAAPIAIGKASVDAPLADLARGIRPPSGPHHTRLERDRHPDQTTSPGCPRQNSYVERSGWSVSHGAARVPGPDDGVWRSSQAYRVHNWYPVIKISNKMSTTMTNSRRRERLVSIMSVSTSAVSEITESLRARASALSSSSYSS